MSAVFPIPAISISSPTHKISKTQKYHKKTNDLTSHVITCSPHYTAYNKLGAYIELYNIESKLDIRV